MKTTSDELAFGYGVMASDGTFSMRSDRFVKPIRDSASASKAVIARDILGAFLPPLGRHDDFLEACGSHATRTSSESWDAAQT